MFSSKGGNDRLLPVVTDAQVIATGTTTFSGTVSTSDGNGTLFFRATGSATEDASAISAGSARPVKAAGLQSVSGSDLVPGSTYYLHFLHRNGRGLEAITTAGPFSTDAVPTSDLEVVGIALTQNDPNDDFLITSSGRGTLNWMIHPTAKPTTVSEAQAALSGSSSSGTLAHDGIGTITRQPGNLCIWGVEGRCLYQPLDEDLATPTLAVSTAQAIGRPWGGVNLARSRDYETSLLLDWGHTARGWRNLDSGLSIGADTNLVRSSGTGKSARFFWSARGDDGRDWSAYSGSFTVLWTGSGTIKEKSGGTTIISQTEGECEFTATLDGNRFLTFENIDASNPPRILWLGQTSKRALHEEGAIFDPDHLARIRGKIGFVRFMNLADINTSTIENLSQYPTESWQRWWQWPLSTKVALCNELGCDMWLNIGHLFNTEMIQNWATYVNANLNPGLRCYVEYTNEQWNSRFPQGSWIRSQANAAGWPGNEHTNKHHFYAKKSVEMFDAFLGEIGLTRETAKNSDRFMLVLGSFLQNPWVSEQVLDARIWKEQEPDNYFPPHQIATYFAVTDYIGNDHENYASVWSTFDSQGAAAAADEADEFFLNRSNRSISQVKGRIQEHLDLIGQPDTSGLTRNIKLTLYEGFSNHISRIPENGALRDWHFDHMQSPRMTRHLIDLWEFSYQRGVDAGAVYRLEGRPAGGGTWGMFEHYARLDERANIGLNYCAAKRRTT